MTPDLAHRSDIQSFIRVLAVAERVIVGSLRYSELKANIDAYPTYDPMRLMLLTTVQKIDAPIWAFPGRPTSRSEPPGRR
jgi:hypothetical protein